MNIDVFDEIIDAIRHSPMSVEAIANHAGVSSVTLYLWLNRTTKDPHLQTIEKVCAALDMSLVLRNGRFRLEPHPRAPIVASYQPVTQSRTASNSLLRMQMRRLARYS